MRAEKGSHSAVAEYLRSLGVVDVSDISYLGTGFVNHNYLVSGREGKFVLRQRRDDIPYEENRLPNEYSIYAFLEHVGYPWVPRVRYFDPEIPALLITYLPAQQTPIDDLTSDELEQLLQKIAQYHSYSFTDYQAFCTERQLPHSEPITPTEDFERFERARYEYLQQHAPDSPWLEWLAPHFAEFERLAYAQPLGQPRLVHGDIKSNILRDADKQLWFIDWELGRFSYYDDFGYILRRQSPSQPLSSHLINLYLKYSGKDRETFAAELTYAPYTKCISTILWALQRAAEVKEKGLPDAEFYLKRARKAKKAFLATPDPSADLAGIREPSSGS